MQLGQRRRVAGFGIVEVEYRKDLVGQQDIESLGGGAEVVTDGEAVESRETEVAGKEELAAKPDDFIEFLYRGHALLIGAVIAQLALGVAVGELLHDIGDDMGVRGHVGKVQC